MKGKLIRNEVKRWTTGAGFKVTWSVVWEEDGVSRCETHEVRKTVLERARRAGVTEIERT